MARPRVYEDGELLGAYEGFVVETRRTSAGDYAPWAKRNGRPSVPTLVARFGSWGRMKALARGDSGA